MKLQSLFTELANIGLKNTNKNLNKGYRFVSVDKGHGSSLLCVP